ncbi:MAG: acetylxylan esterase, partial [Eubacteriales bacterium]
YFVCHTEKPPIAYRCGENIVFELTLKEDGKISSCHTIKWNISADFTECREGSASGKSGKISLNASLDKPGFIYVRAWAVNENGENEEDSIPFDGGAGVEIENIVSATKKPEGYDDFWESCRKELYAVPPEIIEKEKLPDSAEHPNHDIYDMKIACAGGTPISGILTIPRGKSALPCRAIYQGYGVKSAWFDFSDDEIQFCINAHGIENRKPDEYYAELTKGRLARYGFDEKQNQNPHTCYFKYMMIRAAGALRFLMTLPEWDGKNLIARGGSQGAVQAMQATNLVPQVSLLDIFVPWLCDIRGEDVGRLCGWGEFGTRAILFFDSTLRAPYIKCKTVIRAGLGDYTSPPAGVCAMYNALSSKEKELTLVQGMCHTYEAPETEEFKSPLLFL